MATHGYEYDYFVLGGGSGGVRSSRIAASHGAKVALAEAARGGDSADGGFGGLGGTCVNVGCVPKKLMVYGSHYAHDLHDAAAYGWNIKEEGLDWGRFLANKNKEIGRLNGVYANLLKNSGVHVVQGRATLVDAHTVDVDGKRHTADKILIAVGGWPVTPTITHPSTPFPPCILPACKHFQSEALFSPSRPTPSPFHRVSGSMAFRQAHQIG
jgi:glutathione reductase (NADPH)